MQKRVFRQFVGSAFIVVAFIATVIWLARTGAEGRVGVDQPSRFSTHTVELVRTSQELLEVWKREGVRGRRLVHASRYLHFVPVEDDTWFDDLDVFPIETFDLTNRFERSVNARNLLWVALRTGISRTIDHVLPPSVLDEKLTQVGGASATLRGRRRELRVYDQGSLRTIADGFPRSDEPVLLSIDASFLDFHDGASILAILSRSEAKYDLLVLCRSEDNPDVTEASRLRLDALARVLAGPR